jgi:hypothetical protein
VSVLHLLTPTTNATYISISNPTDAEECFGQIINTLRNVPGLPSPSASTSSATVEAAGATETKKFVEQYLMGQMRRELSFSFFLDPAY